MREALTRRDLDGLSHQSAARRPHRADERAGHRRDLDAARAQPQLWSTRSAATSGAIQAPFGGLQIVLVGDFFQLPPIVRRQNDDGMLPLTDGTDAYGAEFAHASPAWRDLAPTVCYLSEQHRQSDQAFADVLAAIRSNACIGDHRQRLTERLIDRDRLPAGCTRLFTHNATVDEINLQQLAKLGGKPHCSA